MNFSNTPEEEMSMEDILSSIRKYVSEEDERKETDSSISKHSEEEHDNDTDSVIKLQESNIVSPISVENSADISPTESAVSYNEKSTLSENVVNTPQPIIKKNPFGQLADALTSYGKNKNSLKSQGKKESSPTIEQFFTAITEKMIEKWIKENLNGIVEKIVIQEIEKMKSEE